APAGQGKAAQNLSVALQSVMQVNPIFRHEQENAASSDFGLPAVDSPPQAPARPAATRSSAPSGGLLGGTVNGVAGATSTVTTSAVGTAGSVVSTTTATSTAASAGGASNPALLRMPSVVAVDHQTTSAIESNLNG